MAALPYMQLYVADYLADTSHLNAAQHGAYLLLLMNYWQRGKSLPDSNDRLAVVARMSNDEWIANREVLSEFFEITENGWFHKRVETDLIKVKGISNAGKIAGLASAKARKERSLNDRSTIAPTERQRNVNHTDTDTDKKKKKRSELVFILPEDVPEPEWNAFVDFRKSKGKFTDYAKSLAVEELRKLNSKGHKMKEVLNQSTMKGWSGLFEVKVNSNGYHSASETKLVLTDPRSINVR